MSTISIRELNQQSASAAAPFTVRAQLEAVLKKTARSGNPFYELRFVDAEDHLVMRAWDDTPAFRQCDGLESRSFFEIDGQFYKNDRGFIEARDWNLRPLDQDEIDALLAGSGDLQERQNTDYAFIEGTIAGVSDPRLKALGQSFLAQFGDRLRRTGAARDYHHARRGGLVEHVAQMMRSAVQICEAYENLNRDLLVTGVLFHDVGKLWENVYAERGFTMPYSEASELISHIPMGMEIVNKFWRDLLDSDAAANWIELEPSSERVRLHLLHLIASHHGEMAFGSPVVPKTPEAYALHYIDNLDAKMEMFAGGYQKAAELAKNVYERVRPLPGRLVQPLEPFVDFAAPADPEPPIQDETGTEPEETGEKPEPVDQLPIPEPTDEELGEEEPF